MTTVEQRQARMEIILSREGFRLHPTEPALVDCDGEIICRLSDAFMRALDNLSDAQALITLLELHSVYLVSEERARKAGIRARALDDIDVREDEADTNPGAECRVEFATFTEGEYVESIVVARTRATELYRELGALLKQPAPRVAGTPSNSAPKVYIQLLHGRKYGEQLDSWGSDGPVFESEAGYFHTTYANEIKFGEDDANILEIVASDDSGIADCVSYDGIFYGDWSVFVSAGELRSGLAARLIPFDPVKAKRK